MTIIFLIYLENDILVQKLAYIHLNQARPHPSPSTKGWRASTSPSSFAPSAKVGPTRLHPSWLAAPPSNSTVPSVAPRSTMRSSSGTPSSSSSSSRPGLAPTRWIRTTRALYKSHTRYSPSNWKRSVTSGFTYDNQTPYLPPPWTITRTGISLQLAPRDHHHHHPQTPPRARLPTQLARMTNAYYHLDLQPQ